jgi:hypothetical protein
MVQLVGEENGTANRVVLVFEVLGADEHLAQALGQCVGASHFIFEFEGHSRNSDMRDCTLHAIYHINLARSMQS